MLSKLAFSVIVAAMGVLGHAVLGIAVRQELSVYGYTAAMLVLNGIFVMFILFLAYMVTGFVEHPCCGEGWLDWPVVVGGFVLGYLPMVLGALWRWGADERKKN